MEDKIFSATEGNFERLAIEVFHFQYALNPVYQSSVKTLGINADQDRFLHKYLFYLSLFSRHTRLLPQHFNPN